MADWAAQWPESRPRWGTYSVKAHQQLGRLVADLLLYDVLVFPCPEDEAEHRRWKGEGWDPGLLALRVTQLGDHAVVMPWDGTLRDGWRERWWRLPEQDREDPETAFALTAAMMADQPLIRLMGEEDDRFGQAVLDQPTVHPAFEGHEGWTRARRERLELVASFQSRGDAAALTGSSGAADLRAPAGAPADGLRLRLRLETPVDADEQTLHRTLDLVQDDDFRTARRRLWSWEATLPAEPDPREVRAGLEALVADYNAAVRRQAADTAATWFFLVVPAVAGAALDELTGGGGQAVAAGIGSSVVFDRVKARLPWLSGRAARASHHPGSAVEGMLAIAGPAEPPRG